ncbi:MAG: hypothetical protein JWM82_2445, partial [Myxococcales bacterium]|nr:hypothetical protein [Myxococcales bacterium]
MTGARPSFAHSLWTARILYGGPALRDILKGLGLTLGMFAVGLYIIRGARHQSDEQAFIPLFGCLIVLMVGLSTMAMEERRARGLAFLELLPQRTHALQFLLWPLRLLCVGVALAFTVVCHLPLAASLIATGCFWWSISIGHFCAGRGGWMKFMFVLLSVCHSFVVGSVVASNDATAAGLRAGIIVALTPALLALLVPYGNKV